MGKSLPTRLVIPLPRGWPRFAKSGLVHAVALARVALLVEPRPPIVIHADIRPN